MPNSPRSKAYASVAARNARAQRRKANGNAELLYMMAINGVLSPKQAKVVLGLRSPAVLKRSKYRLSQISK
jgi:hypothetical protein